MLNFEQARKYFERIGQLPLFEAFQQEQVKPSLATLREIFFHHAITFPFENLDMHNVINEPNTKPTPIDLNSIFEKMVQNGRGGYCFETNELLRRALQFLKFDVKIFNAGVHWLKPKKIPPCHEVLVVNLAGNEYLVEPGFGSPSPLEPLLFRENGKLYEKDQIFEQHDVKRFRFILDEDGEFQLQGQIKVDWRSESLWKPLYAFKTDNECGTQELAECNQKVSASEQSPFLERLFVTIPFKIAEETTGRKTLMQNVFKVSTPAGVKETLVESQQHFFALLATEFNIKLPVGSSLTAKNVKFAEHTSDLQGKLAQMLSTQNHIVAPISQPGFAPVPVVPAFCNTQQAAPLEAVPPLVTTKPNTLSSRLDGMM